MTSRRTIVALTSVILLALTACAPGPEPILTEEPAATVAPLPTASPAAAVVTVGAAEQPPQVTGGDCAAAIPENEFAAVLGEAAEFDGATWVSESALLNVGGMSCRLAGDGIVAQLEVLPLTADVSVPVVPSAHADSLTQCSVEGCGWMWQDSQYLVSGRFSSDLSQEGMLDGANVRTDVDAWGETLGPIVASRLTALQEPEWVRDRDGWCSDLSCDALANAVGSEMGLAVSGEDLYPLPLLTIAQGAAWEMTKRPACTFFVGDRERIGEVSITPGGAWQDPIYQDPENSLREGTVVTVDGVALMDVAMYDDGQFADYEFRDQVNSGGIYAVARDGYSVQQVAEAITRAVVTLGS